MTCSTSRSCNALQGTTRANPSLSDSFRPSFTLHLNLFSVSRMAWVRWLKSGSSLPLKRCFALCVPTNQTTGHGIPHDMNSTCKPTSTWEAKNKLLPQRDAIGDNCTNRTFQLHPPNVRNNVFISFSGVTGTVSTYTFPIFVRFSTCETFLVFAFALSLSLGGLTFHLLALSRAFSFALAFRRLWLVLPFSWPDFFPSPVPFSFHDLDPLPDAFDVLDFAPAHAGDLTFFCNITCST